MTERWPSSPEGLRVSVSEPSRGSSPREPAWWWLTSTGIGGSRSWPISGSKPPFFTRMLANQTRSWGAVAFALERFGGLHVMFNNAGTAGIRHPTLFDVKDFSDFHRVMDVNLLGVMVGTREAARHMAEATGGSIINISSVGGMQFAPSLWAYHLSKSGVIDFTKEP